MTRATTTPAERRAEYTRLWDATETRRDYRQSIQDRALAIAAGRERYQSVADPREMPWEVVAVLHELEASCNFRCHLHNGDPMAAGPTTRVPSGRPPGAGPWTWEQSASDALDLKEAASVALWDVPSTLEFLEKWNGYGYRNKGIPSPFLWSRTYRSEPYEPVYRSGYYVADHQFDPKATSRQTGAVALLRALQWEPEEWENDRPEETASPAAPAAPAATKESSQEENPPPGYHYQNRRENVDIKADEPIPPRSPSSLLLGWILARVDWHKITVSLYLKALDVVNTWIDRERARIREDLGMPPAP